MNQHQETFLVLLFLKFELLCLMPTGAQQSTVILGWFNRWFNRFQRHSLVATDTICLSVSVSLSLSLSACLSLSVCLSVSVSLCLSLSPSLSLSQYIYLSLSISISIYIHTHSKIPVFICACVFLHPRLDRFMWALTIQRWRPLCGSLENQSVSSTCVVCWNARFIVTVMLVLCVIDMSYINLK